MQTVTESGNRDGSNPGAPGKKEVHTSSARERVSCLPGCFKVKERIEHAAVALIQLLSDDASSLYDGTFPTVSIPNGLTALGPRFKTRAIFLNSEVLRPFRGRERFVSDMAFEM